MRWIKKEYKEGDERTVERFLLLPKKLKGEYRWLEKAKIKQRLKKFLYQSEPYADYFNEWQDLEWAD